MADIVESDLSIDLSSFKLENVPGQTRKLNEQLIKSCEQDTKWWMCGAQEYRRRRAAGETPFPQPATLKDGGWFTIEGPSRNQLPCRLFEPQQPARGVFYHMHGGGYVLGSAGAQDLLLKEICDGGNLVVVSIDYRLAPEHPYPAAIEDCIAGAEWLMSNATGRWGCPLNFIGGESAGASLSALVLLHLKKINSISMIRGAILNYGQYDLSHLPSMVELDPSSCLVLGMPDAQAFLETYLPGKTMEQRKSPTISAAYGNLQDMCPAIFIIGTEDGLIDDSILMAARWQIAGNEAILKLDTIKVVRYVQSPLIAGYNRSLHRPNKPIYLTVSVLEVLDLSMEAVVCFVDPNRNTTKHCVYTIYNLPSCAAPATVPPAKLALAPLSATYCPSREGKNDATTLRMTYTPFDIHHFLLIHGLLTLYCSGFRYVCGARICGHGKNEAKPALNTWATSPYLQKGSDSVTPRQ
ncbi:hypothetical protein NM208_g8826 [Fusarium decemcellulare]|uniref:Uncharacterized protein n=1 Tax=Fusarium decemcellulare TaxID=57161 RepID=A0ACC1S416_9HYPO|nr:hypothetical protein NM208_g8826 [Fusarium decemcellulare]